MKLLRFRSLILLLMIAVALIGLNFAALKSSLSHYPRPERLGYSMAGAHKVRIFGADGSYAVFDGTRKEYDEFLAGKASEPSKLRIIRPPDPTLFQIWLPVMISGAVTLVVLVLVLAVAVFLRRSSKSPSIGEARDVGGERGGGGASDVSDQAE